MARFQLCDLVQQCLRDQPGMGQRTTGEAAKMLGIPKAEQLLQSVQKIISKEAKSENASIVEPTKSKGTEPFPTKLDPFKTRTWTDESGKFSVEASLVSVAESMVRLRKPNDQEILVPLSRLSKTDQEFLKINATRTK